MEREDIIKWIIDNKVLAVVRLKETDRLLKVIEALVKGGVKGIELTMTIPNAIQAIESTAEEFGSDIMLGVGSVVEAQTALMAINAGAQFVVSPIYKPNIVQLVKGTGKVVIPGCFTPTEIQNAYEQGADFAKIFPADNLGMSFIKSIKAPLPHLKVIPTGGVTLDNANDWIKHGASAVGIGSALVDKKAIENEDYDRLKEYAERLCLNLGLNREK
ncbi:MAG: bifunctional 4-hydroxy-2-oxoglutarate aldolase/2-dehydro-3-deoxy-phosphogluconate aldolase [Melioribacteraceae bacterium]|nr:bifunctional 4-hydroxy-2-oxoglutarate aldolase/2-dehydro-3-deoxy-phosphogluconate aldolase [Melioribacteraceae bacterium]